MKSWVVRFCEVFTTPTRARRVVGTGYSVWGEYGDWVGYCLLFTRARSGVNLTEPHAGVGIWRQDALGGL